MRFRWTVIALAVLVSLFVLFKPADDEDSWKTPNITLGLDLRGGIFMQLEVDTVDALHQFIEEQAGSIKTSLQGDEFTVAGSDFDIEKEQVTLTGVTSSTKPEVLSELNDRYGNDWIVKQEGSDFTFKVRDRKRSQVMDDAVSQAVYKIQNRIGELGVTEPVITRALNSNRIILELAGADDVERVQKIVKEPGKLEWRLVHPNSPIGAPSEAELLRPYGGTVPAGTKVFPTTAPNGSPSYLLLQEVKLTSRHILDVHPSRDDRGLPAVGVTLNREGGKIFENTTKDNVGQFLAIVLDKKVLSYPRIESMLSDRFIIRGQFTQQEVVDMVIKIKSGSLPAEVRILEERVIGPTLGRDARNQGAISAAIGLVLVIFFMMFWYSRAGVYSVLALVLNLILILGILAGLGAVLTLPGIAGFILTIGMAVDANVLVFERIREELKKGQIPKQAVAIGFKTAFITIMDANITTFIAAFCLLLMGEGPIKGFAVMLMIGIVCSIFTAVFCSHTFFLSYLARKQPDTLGIWPIGRQNV
ncbi:MAG: protein translocase subunit SecD [Acidobacteria bacterium]|nr:protein translocase subunit SecD [Acidobacteriota bacterium]